MQLNLPILLTLLRIALIPVFVGVFFLSFPGVNLVCSALFGLAALTDWLDGYLARRLGQTSAFGAFLDPVADKLMVAVALVLLVQAIPTPLIAVSAAIIIGREIAISALREWMAQIGKQGQVAVSMIGKLKTTAQMVAVLLLLYRDPLWFFPTLEIGLGLLVIAAVLTLWSMLHYLMAAWFALK
ncbi:MAG: CDP-diacylglycerol--glycerol-3-phosphate 3-phosphatidyltransferase [Candidatus Competibacter denitrificans]|jgi:CDP-diacylglycerol--glycerol-3-phosphate 3-phosphatidyltransferase|uniref:CDP-diacylglycerol--glycerol-3-phosphate 3-phosphatidyltransferase n=1 Tax=Candidatus Competibacter denitrificans Run_A_D11 TaxID=1400863 RepID=W6M759_9GAMM|nr:CDP-diacylglycerol--glycerol-3-phosphate 3-phosphatidyltransferase [Candidatus Competibacter denitrificans]CDI01530.1 phosphatidylglycerophosphate synthetase (CDP-1,2-diacyl-sn-glycero-3-phosphate phosphatidyl transferase) [Candidatus Competibacter denitrificans Run_A_D11]HRC68585.1 CDP-diacylglycerol--glycerol-3-phosphate 3-phosphatidyltransferase [Candidatus Competibacter denitrificans]